MGIHGWQQKLFRPRHALRVDISENITLSGSPRKPFSICRPEAAYTHHIYAREGVEKSATISRWREDLPVGGAAGAAGAAGIAGRTRGNRVNHGSGPAGAMNSQRLSHEFPRAVPRGPRAGLARRPMSSHPAARDPRLRRPYYRVSYRPPARAWPAPGPYLARSPPAALAAAQHQQRQRGGPRSGLSPHVSTGAEHPRPAPRHPGRPASRLADLRVKPMKNCANLSRRATKPPPWSRPRDFQERQNLLTARYVCTCRMAALSLRWIVRPQHAFK
jgi:hypothetical protein